MNIIELNECTGHDGHDGHVWLWTMGTMGTYGHVMNMIELKECKGHDGHDGTSEQRLNSHRLFVLELVSSRISIPYSTKPTSQGIPQRMLDVQSFFPYSILIPLTSCLVFNMVPHTLFSILCLWAP